MPDDYQNLFDELGGSAPALDLASLDQDVQNPNDLQDTGALPENVTPVTDPEVPETVPVVNEEQEAIPTPNPAAQAFAEFRTQNAKYHKLFKQMQATMGVDSEDAVIERLTNVTYGAQAKQQNIDPVVLKRINDLEEHNQELQSSQRQNFVKDSFANVQKEFGLSNAEVIGFAEQLTSKQVDIFASNIDLPTLYRGMHYEAMTKKMLEAEKQKWIQGDSVASNAPGVNPATGKKSTKDKVEINTMADLDTVMKNFPK